MQAEYIIPDLRGIRSAISSELGYSVLIFYLWSRKNNRKMNIDIQFVFVK
jgi:hypothetical protein